MALRPPSPTEAGAPPLTPAGFEQWLDTHGVSHLLEPLRAADARDTWAQDGANSPFLAEVLRLYDVLATATPAAHSTQPSVAAQILNDLTPVLAYLRTSRSLQFLAAFTRRFPDSAEHLVEFDTASSSRRSAEASVVAQRLRYLIRQQCFRELFGPVRRAEVMAAVAAAAR